MKKVLLIGIVVLFATWLIQMSIKQTTYNEYLERIEILKLEVSRYTKRVGHLPDKPADLFSDKYILTNTVWWCDYETIPQLEGKGFCDYSKHGENSFKLFVGKNSYWLIFDSKLDTIEIQEATDFPLGINFGKFLPLICSLFASIIMLILKSWGAKRSHR